ncbi:MAG: CBS domain-containing protein [Actinobacteria bacterium]|nr:CBS domain-containing protein [Actinomycetota bacterium]
MKKAHNGRSFYGPVTRLANCSEPGTVTPDTSLKEAAGVMLEMKVGGLPVVDGERLVGIITETDLLNALREMLPGD